MLWIFISNYYYLIYFFKFLIRNFLQDKFNYQKNKISIFSNLNYLDGASAPVETSKIYYPNQLWSNNSQRKYYNNSIGGRIGVDYQISKKWTIGIQYLGSFSKPKISEKNITKKNFY